MIGNIINRNKCAQIDFVARKRTADTTSKRIYSTLPKLFTLSPLDENYNQKIPPKKVGSFIYLGVGVDDQPAVQY